MDKEYDAIIIGAGASGLMCSVQAGLLGKKTLLIEGNGHAGAKILISGGGRCNFTNLHTNIKNFETENPNFLLNILSRWTVDDTIDFFEKYGGIQGEEKTLGQLFPNTNKAKDVVAMFTKLMYKTNQDIWLSTKVNAVQKRGNEFFLTLNKQGKEMHISTPKVVIATGGLPVAKLGASDFALRIAREMNLKVIETAPALVPLAITGKEADWYASLAGNAVFAQVSNSKILFEENILFTHWGLSGPAILQISTYWRPGEEFIINLLPRHDLSELIKLERQNGGKRTVGNLLNDYFSKKLVEAFSKFLPINLKIASLSKNDANLIISTIHKFKVKPAGDKGYDKAEVMRGGISTSELCPDTLATIKHPGLYFIGEAVDITGWLGGYNFQWAWASGFAVANDL